MHNSPAIHFNVMVVFSLSRRAILTFFGSPLRRRRNSDSVQFNRVSRLARNCADWHRLMQICALTNTLILDEDGLYNPGHFNDRLLLGLKATMSEAELHILSACCGWSFGREQRSADYKSAIRQIKNLRYGKQILLTQLWSGGSFEMRPGQGGFHLTAFCAVA
jgi:DNA invertase Pin-like site-specific DNA recombinase